jgi:hypothetical protein
MSEAINQTATVAGLHHDLVAKRSFVTFIWEGSPDRRLVLDVPFGTTLDDANTEAEKALRSFATQLATTPIKYVG